LRINLQKPWTVTRLHNKHWSPLITINKVDRHFFKVGVKITQYDLLTRALKYMPHFEA